MGRITAVVIGLFRTWDRTAQISFLLGVILLLILLAVLATQPAPELRQPVLIGLGGLVIALQVIVMWANRGMVTPFTRAQRAFLAGRLDEARALLEAEREADRADFRMLTFLGNVYRQLGQLDASAAVLREALEAEPNHHFPLYGFGRTLLVTGQYADALEAFSAAETAGAPAIVYFDLGETLFRTGADAERIRLSLEQASIEDEPRRLLAAYILYRTGIGPQPEQALIDAGLGYWEATAERFAGTAYGAALHSDVNALRAIREEQ